MSEAYERRFVKDYRAGTKLRWAACMAAVRVREKGDTSRVAGELALAPLVINNMAQAGLCYRALRQYAGKKKKVSRLREIRGALTYSHFVMAGRYMFIKEIPVKDIFEALGVACDERASTRDLASYLIGEYGDADENEKMWMPVLRRTMKELENLLNNFATPYEVKMRIREIKSELAVWLKDE